MPHSTIYKIFEELNQSSVRYCHFKSNACLSDAFKGTSDFDVLVHREDFYLFDKILLNFDAKRRMATFNAMYEGTDNYLVYCSADDATFHFHTHCDLIYGAPLQKNHIVQNIDQVLAHAVLHPDYPVKVLPSGMELSLLVQRILLKHSFLNAAFWFHKLVHGRPFSPGYEIELNYLIERRDSESWAHPIEFTSTTNQEIDFLEAYKSGQLSLAKLARLKWAIISALKPYSRLPINISRNRYKTRKKAKRYPSRWPVNGGFSVAIIGADGSGKSTLSSALVDWLNYKLDAEIIYLGRPKNVLIDAGYKFAAVLRKLGLKKSAQSLSDRMHLNCAKMRWRQFVNGQKLANAGKIILFERFPLRQFRSMDTPMDGPKIKQGNALLKKELAIYDRFPDGADLNIVLNVGPTEATMRKSEHQGSASAQAMVESKTSAVENLVKNLPKNFYVIDANQDAETVLIQSKRLIWSKL